jgi:hypothetical protein
MIMRHILQHHVEMYTGKVPGVSDSYLGANFAQFLAATPGAVLDPGTTFSPTGSG